MMEDDTSRVSFKWPTLTLLPWEQAKRTPNRICDSSHPHHSRLPYAFDAAKEIIWTDISHCYLHHHQEEALVKSWRSFPLVRLCLFLCLPFLWRNLAFSWSALCTSCVTCHVRCRTAIATDTQAVSYYPKMRPRAIPTKYQIPDKISHCLVAAWPACTTGDTCHNGTAISIPNHPQPQQHGSPTSHHDTDCPTDPGGGVPADLHKRKHEDGSSCSCR
mmetsp:Transcript_9911/g.22876  ORF Transcript_9911/g.22876 Transcript_9911/m.22876 type:complete len:217 (-) Transcript_9911:52-702(-)